jgi:Family of unknown function (DUF5696)
VAKAMPAVPVLLLAASVAASEEPLLPRQWGAPPVSVSRAGDVWTIAGEKQQVTLDAKTLSLSVNAAGATWTMPSADAAELVVVQDGDELRVRLRDAREIRIERYEAGFKSGVKITLDGFRSTGIRSPGAPVGVRLYLTLALEGGDEDLGFEIAAVERGGAAIRQLDWPPAVDGRSVDTTVLSHDDGTLLPRDWPKPYHAIHRARNDTSVIQSHLIESWSMSWWGFLKTGAGMMLIVETPDDAAYAFSHPAGGPTTIGPVWRAQLGRFGPLRSLRMAFLPKADHVALAKRYRRHVVESGLFVSLQEKIARTPLVQNLIGNAFARVHVLRNVAKGGPRYDTETPENNYRLTTFAEHARRLAEWKTLGLERLNVTLAGWPSLGYDRQHPDGLPPTEAGGGWAGMKAFFDACAELGHTCWLHDQYRDYYPDAPSYRPEFAVHEQDTVRRTDTFPGTRFSPHNFKEGYIPFLNYWDGGKQAYLNSRYMLGHIQKNYRLMSEHGLRPKGSYNDVFGYVPPDQDFNPEHPTTRTESMRYRAEVLNWTRANLGIVGTEDGADWTVPYVDYAESRFNRNPGSGNDATGEGAIVAPLYDLVYHDAVVTTGSPSDPRTLLFGHAPQIGRNWSPDELPGVLRAAALHRRVGLLELTRHEFLDAARRRERTTFADGTTVTVDWETKQVEIDPPVGE